MTSFRASGSGTSLFCRQESVTRNTKCARDAKDSPRLSSMKSAVKRCAVKEKSKPSPKTGHIHRRENSVSGTTWIPASTSHGYKLSFQHVRPVWNNGRNQQVQFSSVQNILTPGTAL
ncbi:hypothetical protein NPIL_258741 [Nephila pilipes]|uniref:Uncharacterized protein n=1 Tax=Nephila pilipes TaxID=299642 RepID=A0A8X6U330_NEPPI|nr:hypothetical protein NPIL_258741 [Nephila pilipes]